MNATAPAAGKAATATSGTNPAPPKSSGEPIECTVVHQFYSDDGRLMEPGQSYLYQPVEDRPFPWKLIRPTDTALEKDLREEYEDYKAAKLDDLDKRSTTNLLLDRLAGER